MKTSFSLIFASATATFAIGLGLPAFAAMKVTDATFNICDLSLCATASRHPDQSARRIRGSGEDADLGCDDEDGGEDGCAAATANPMPAGTGTPLANGLFDNSTTPVALAN